ncbi:MAG TPA: cyclic peptide export ABC transporter, partial [Longimicrobiaceae bacterium]
VNTALYRDNPLQDPTLVWGFVALCVTLPLTRAISSYVLTLLAQHTVLRMRKQLSRAILQAPLRRLEEAGSPKLLAALTGDVATVTGALTALPGLFVQVAVVVGALAYLGWLSGTVLLATLAVLVVGAVTYQIPMAAGARRQKLLREQADRLYQHFRAITEGSKELKLHHGRQDAMIDNLDRTGAEVRRHLVGAATIFSAAAGWGQLVVFSLIGSLVFVIPTLYDVELKTLTGYALILLYLVTPIEGILNTFPALNQAQIAFRKVRDLGLSLDSDLPGARPLSVDGEDRDGDAAPGRPVPAHSSWNSLELVGVTHTYYQEREDGHFTLGPIDLSLRPGELVFVVGGNGSGKTTFAKLLLGLYYPETGELRLDGNVVTDENRSDFQQLFSVIFSDFYLFETLLGLDAPDTDARAGRYLARLELDHKVKVQGGELSTTALSQGQRKRLALLTAYLEDRPIYLFDEWAADQDPVFKEVFYRELLPELKARGKSVIVISHDDRYYGVADRILKLEFGQLVYDGDPDGLFARGAEVAHAEVAHAGAPELKLV